MPFVSVRTSVLTPDSEGFSYPSRSTSSAPHPAPCGARPEHPKSSRGESRDPTGAESHDLAAHSLGHEHVPSIPRARPGREAAPPWPLTGLFHGWTASRTVGRGWGWGGRIWISFFFKFNLKMHISFPLTFKKCAKASLVKVANASVFKNPQHDPCRGQMSFHMCLSDGLKVLMFL